MVSFHKFVEDEAAPAMDGPTSPPVPGSEDSGTHNDSRVLNKELGISDEDAVEVDRTKTFLCNEEIEFPEDGVVVLPPIDVRIEPIDDENMFKLTVYATNPRKIQDMNGNDYQGDKLEFTKEVNKEYVEAIKAQGWGSGGGMPGMGSPMGGGPPMMAHTEYPTFADWIQLKEVGTATCDVAVFARPAIPQVRRMYPNLITFGTDKKQKKKKPYQQPQIED